MGTIVGTGPLGKGTPDQFWNWGAVGQKFADFTSTSTAINSADNAAGVTESMAQLTSPGGFNGPNLTGLVPNLWTTSTQAAGAGQPVAGLFNIPLGWVTPAFVSTTNAAGTFAGAGFAAVVDISMASDQAGFSYAHQLSMLLGAAPYFIDYAFALAQLVDPSGYSAAEVWFNNGFGSANPDNTG